MKNLTFALLLALMGAVAAGCTGMLLGGQAGGQQQSSSQTTQDRAISSTVQVRLAGDPLTGSSEISVATLNAVVTLKGDVASVKISQRAAEIASSVSNVRSVRNHLWVGPGG